MDIDFETTYTPAEVTASQALGTDKSTSVKTLTQLHEAVKSGQAKYGQFYKVGEYKNSSGAQTAIRNINTKFADRLSFCMFDLEPVIKVDPEDAKRRISQLLACVPEDQREIDEAAAASREGADEQTDSEDEVVDVAVDATPAKRNRK